MPSSTFFRLPEEKRDKLLSAAWAEFARVPYPDASINRIIRDAGIPRGSFYMYFTDKGELFHYLLSEYGQRLVGRVELLLDEQGGDLFAAFLGLYDYILADLRRRGRDYQLVVHVLRLNPEMRPTAFVCGDLPPLLRRLTQRLDPARLDLRGEDDLQDILRVLIGVTGPAITEAVLAEDPAPARTRYVNILAILARGMATKPEPASS